MDTRSNLIDNVKIEEIDKSISAISEDLEKAKLFKKFYDSDDFQEFIVNELLVESSNALCKTLISEDHTAESERTVLNRLKGLRELQGYVDGRVGAIARLESALEQEKEYKIKVINGEED